MSLLDPVNFVPSAATKAAFSKVTPGATSGQKAELRTAIDVPSNADLAAASLAGLDPTKYQGQITSLAQAIPAAGTAGRWYYSTVAGTLTDPDTGSAVVQNGGYLIDTGSAWVARNAPVVTPVNVYCDSSAANDTGTGLSPTSPKKTLAAAAAVAALITVPGVTLNLAAGGRWFETLPFISNVNVRSYGQGLPPIVDGSRAVPSIAWAAHATAANVYQATVTFEESTRNPASTADRFHPMAWVESDTSTAHTETRLSYYKAGADQAACIAYVSANPGTFYMQKVGTTVVDPAASAGTQFIIYVHLPDSSAPTANSQTVYHTTQKVVGVFGANQEVYNVRFQRSGCKDMLAVDYTSTVRPSRFERVSILDSAIHGIVAEGMEFYDCRAIGLSTALVEGGGFHNFRSTASVGTSKGCRFVRCYAKNYAYGYYTHGSGGGVPDHNSFDVQDCVAENCIMAYGSGSTLSVSVIDGLDAINCDTAISAIGKFKAKRVKHFSRVSIATPIISRADFLLEDSQFVNRAGGGQYVIKNDTVSAISADVRRCTFVNMGSISTASARNVNMTMVDSIYQQTNGTNWPWTGTLNISNSYIEFGSSNLDALRTTYGTGIATSCITPYQKQTWDHVVVDADTTKTYGTRSATYGGTGDILTLSSVDNYPAVRGIRVVDAYGSGLHYDGTLVSILSTGPSGQIQVTPAPTAAFTSKAIRYFVNNRVIFPATEETCAISRDGLQIAVTETWRYSVGQWIMVSQGASGNYARVRPGTRWGARKITAISGSVVTLNAACLWAIGTTSSYKAIDGTGSGRSLPTVQVGYRFPIFPLSTVYTNNLVGGGSEVSTEAATGIQSKKGGTAGSAPFLDTSLASNSYNNLRLDEGYIDAGFFVQIGDSLNVTVNAEISENFPQWESDPQVYGVTRLRYNTVLSNLKLGYQGQISPLAGFYNDRSL